MYEDMSYEKILKRMLDRIPNTVDKREGSIIYDALAPAAIEIANMYIECDNILNETFADTASRHYLIKRAAERGIIPEEATYSILQAEFTPIDLEIPIGSRFNGDILNYTVTEKISDGVYKVQCETVGESGNTYFGSIIPIDYIQGLETAEITQLLIPGEDEEDTEVFRSRYFASLNSQAFGGNIADYKETVNSLNGVGGCKVYPVWNGGGTVKIVVINSEYRKPSDEHIEVLQTAIDPVTNQGEGLGTAPIGHKVTVIGVTEEEIEVSADLEYRAGYSWENIETEFYKVIDAYFNELNQDWANQDSIVIRISQIETRILEITGVLDIRNTKINGEEENCILGADVIAVRKES